MAKEKLFESLLKMFKGLSDDEKEALAAKVFNMMAETQDHKEDNKIINAPALKPNCPYCAAKASLGFIIKKGNCKGSQRYLCKSCGKYFVPTTNTAFAFTRKDADIWRRFISMTISGETLHTCAAECHLSYQTAFTWRHKILNAFVVNQKSTKMKGTIEVDEMLIPISYKGNHIRGDFGVRKLADGVDNGLPRKGYERGTDNRSLSSNDKACVFCMVEDGNKGYYAAVPGVGFMSNVMLENTVGKHVDRENALMLADNYRITQQYFEDNGYRHMALASNTSNNRCDHKPEIRDGKHLQHINAMHHHLRNFLKPYYGVSSKYLENYVALYIWLKTVNKTKQKQKKMVDKVSVARVSEPDCYISQRNLKQKPSIPMCA